MFFSEVEEHLEGIGTACGIQPVIAATTSAFNKGLGRLTITKQILLNIATNLFEVRLYEESTIHVINMLGNGLHVYTTFTCLGEYSQYLLIVSQNCLEFIVYSLEKKKTGMP